MLSCTEVSFLVSSIGQAGFFAMGGYASAVLTTVNLLDFGQSPGGRLLKRLGILMLERNSYGDEILHFSGWVACLVALLITVCVAFLIGMPVLKLKGHYLAMATLGFGTIIYRLVLGVELFGEADGIANVPGFSLLPGVTVSGDFAARVLNY